MGFKARNNDIAWKRIWATFDKWFDEAGWRNWKDQKEKIEELIEESMKGK